MGRNWTRKSIEEIFWDMFKKYGKGGAAGAIESVYLYRPYVFGNTSYASGVDMLIACNNFDSASFFGLSTLDGKPLISKKTFPNPTDDYSEIYVLRFSLNPSASSQYVNSVKSKLTNLYFMGYNFDSTAYLRTIRYVYFIDNTNHIAYKLELSTQQSTATIRFQTDTASMSYSGYTKSVGRITVTQTNSALDRLDTALQNEGLSFGYMYMSNVPITDAQLTNELGCTTIQTLSY
jgi:hypothetical protein